MCACMRACVCVCVFLVFFTGEHLLVQKRIPPPLVGGGGETKAVAVHKLWHLSWPRCSDEAGVSCALVELALWPCDLENPTAGHILHTEVRQPWTCYSNG